MFYHSISFFSYMSLLIVKCVEIPSKLILFILYSVLCVKCCLFCLFFFLQMQLIHNSVQNTSYRVNYLIISLNDNVSALLFCSHWRYILTQLQSNFTWHALNFYLEKIKIKYFQSQILCYEILILKKRKKKRNKKKSSWKLRKYVFQNSWWYNYF